MNFGVEQIAGDENFFFVKINGRVALAMAVTVLRPVNKSNVTPGSFS